jgi:hypothetical protein
MAEPAKEAPPVGSRVPAVRNAPKGTPYQPQQVEDYYFPYANGIRTLTKKIQIQSIQTIMQSIPAGVASAENVRALRRLDRSMNTRTFPTWSGIPIDEDDTGCVKRPGGLVCDRPS